MQIAGLGAPKGRQEGALAGAGPVKRPIVAYDRHFDRRLCSETETVFFSHDSRLMVCAVSVKAGCRAYSGPEQTKRLYGHENKLIQVYKIQNQVFKYSA